MSQLPKKISRYFWGDTLQDLDWDKHKDYITKTLLEKGDEEAIRWLLQKADRQYLRNIVIRGRLEPRSKNFWKIYLS